MLFKVVKLLFKMRQTFEGEVTTLGREGVDLVTVHHDSTCILWLLSLFHCVDDVRVARVEQTETPEMMQERLKQSELANQLLPSL